MALRATSNGVYIYMYIYTRVGEKIDARECELTVGGRRTVYRAAKSFEREFDSNWKM